MVDLLQALLNTPVPSLLVTAGIVFLLVAFAGKISTVVEVPEKQRRTVALTGVLFLGIGILLYLLPTLQAKMPPITPTSLADVQSLTSSALFEATVTGTNEATPALSITEDRIQTSTPDLIPSSRLPNTPTFTRTTTATQTSTSTIVPTSIFSPTPLSPENLLVGENFDDYLAQGWTVSEQGWEIAFDGQNAVYQTTLNDAAIMRIGEAGWQNYAVEFQIRALDNTGSFYVHTHASNLNESKLVVILYWSENQIRLMNTSASGSLNDLDMIYYSLPQNEWLTVQIEVLEHEISVTINGRDVLRAELEQNYGGGVALGSANGLNVQLDNIRIWTLSEPFIPSPTPTPTSTITPIPNCNRLVFENFENFPTSRWIASEEGWRIAFDGQNAVYQIDPPSAYIRVGEAGWQNYAIEFQIRALDKNGSFYVHTHASDLNESKLIVVLDWSADQIRLMNVSSSVPLDDLQMRHYSLPQNEWLTVRFEVMEREVFVTINERNVLWSELEQNYQGYVALGSANGLNVQLDNIRIWTLAPC